MRAANPVENSGNADVVRISRPASRHHPPPVYAERAGRDLATTTLSLNVDLRGWPAQLAQWLVVFGVFGLLIGGAKWWSAPRPVDPRHDLAPSTAAASTPPSGTRAVRPAAALATPTAPIRSPEIASSSNGPGAATAETGALVAVAVSDEQDATVPPAQALRTPRVRAPAQVPYPRRIHDVQPRMPSNLAAKRGIAVLSLLIDTAGNVAEVKVLRGLDPALDGAVVAAARQWRFEPTTHRGRAVAVRGNFTVKVGY